MMFQEQFIRIRVDEAFKGVVIGKTIELHEGGTDCSAKFRTGQRAVFYMYEGETPESFVVPACTHSIGSADAAGDDLLFLRGLPRSAIGTRLSGEVELDEDTGSHSSRTRGVPNVKVKISGPKGFARDLVTNSAGVYEVYGLQPGKYSVTIQVPKGMWLGSPLTTGSPQIPGEAGAVQIGSKGSASVNFYLQPDTLLDGRMLDASGKPRPHVCFSLQPVGASNDDTMGFECSNVEGFFRFQRITPGKYFLVAHDEVKTGALKSNSTLYYPGVRDRERAAVISIELNKYLTDLEVRAPSEEKRVTISGKLKFADGVPAAHAMVSFISPQHGYSETTSSNSDGSFALAVVAGMDGRLDGTLRIIDRLLTSCPELKVSPRRRGIFRFIDAKPVPVASDADHEGIAMELTSPSCKSLPNN